MMSSHVRMAARGLFGLLLLATLSSPVEPAAAQYVGETRLAGSGGAPEPRDPSERDDDRHPQVDPRVLAAFEALEHHIERLPGNILSRGQRNSLLKKLENAEDHYEDGRICPAFHEMDAFLHETQSLRRAGPPPQASRVAAMEDVYARGRSLRDSFFDVFLDNPNLPSPGRCFSPTARQEPQARIVASDNAHFAATVSFGAPTMWTVQRAGETWTQVALPGAQSQIGPPGLPAVPSWQALVAVPSGAQPRLSSPVTHLQETIHLNLSPFQREAMDPGSGPDDPLPPPQTFADPPFEKDAPSYATNALQPPEPCAVRPLGQYRDLQIAQVQCTAGQYNPATDELRLFDSVAFDVRFQGGNGAFITSQSLSPFEPSSTSGMEAVLNQAVLTNFVRPVDLSGLPCVGEELLILTHSTFRAAADALAVWKLDKGITTTVIDVGSGTSYDTAARIDALIKDRYDRCIVRPSYVLLMGDAEWVPPSHRAMNVSADPTTGTDIWYAFLEDTVNGASVPDFAVARIPVDTAAEAQTVVDKIIQYESNPPDALALTPFYSTASLVSQFQCCLMDQDGSPLGDLPGQDQRSFIQTQELVRNELVSSGYTAERIYTRTVDSGGYCLTTESPCPADQLQKAYSGNTTPNRYFDGHLLPSALRSGSGFPWDGSTQDIVDAFNAGRFLIAHRDHGWAAGWVNPAFTTTTVSSLINGALLPVVYSVNCASGWWDSETDSGGTTESFMEQLLLRSGGGMVGGLGDVRNSPSWANSALTRGFFDATWPNVAPEYGSATPQRRLGDILNHGKLYLATQVGVAQPAGEVTLSEVFEEWILWHAFGDPTLEMWTSNPHRRKLPATFTQQMEGGRLVVDYAAEGATITALQRLANGSIRPVGRAAVRGGKAAITFFVQPDPQLPVMLSASRENAVSVLLTPRVPARPDLVVTALDLGASTNVARGEELSSRLRITVGNLGQVIAPGSINPDGSVEAGDRYSIDVVLSADRAVPPGFAGLPLPAGVAFAEDGLLAGGRVSRTPDVPAGGSLILPIGAPIFTDVGGTIPLQAPLGTLYLCARIDPGNGVAESNQDNNVFCAQVTVN